MRKVEIMSKKSKKNKKDKKAKKGQRKESNHLAAPGSSNGGQKKHDESEMTQSDFAGELRRIQMELARLQEWASQRAGT
jgi:hypothetical protein